MIENNMILPVYPCNIIMWFFAPFAMVIVISGMSALIRFIGTLLLNKFSKPELVSPTEKNITE